MSLGLGLGLNITGRRDPDAAIVSMFANGERGMMYDLSNRLKLYQDSARTTLVAANGDPIGSVTDLSPNLKHASQTIAASRPLWQGSHAVPDGIDDGWTTSAVDFTGTDKVTVVISCRVLTKTNAPLVDVGNRGIGSFLAAHLNSTNPYPLGGVKGNGTTFSSVYVASGSPTGTDEILSFQFNLAGATPATENIVRRNGSLPANVTNDPGPAGAGNFGLHAVQICSSTYGKAHLRIYRMFVIGRTLTAVEIAKVERWCAVPTGIVF